MTMNIGSACFSVVIPAYNEGETINNAILNTKRVLGNEVKITVVDDGSLDETSAIARHAGVKVIRHETNRGKGAAVKTGALECTSEWLLVLDADLSTRPDEINYFLPYLETNDILFGSRRVRGATIDVAQPWYRIKAGQLFNWLMRKASGLPFHDTQCGFKAYRMKTCRVLFEAQTIEGWSFDAELLMRANAIGLRLREVPIAWRHVEGSRVRLWHAFQILRDLMRLQKLIRKES